MKQLLNKYSITLMLKAQKVCVNEDHDNEEEDISVDHKAAPDLGFTYSGVDMSGNRKHAGAAAMLTCTGCESQEGKMKRL